MIKKVNAIYFSATGTTRKMVIHIAKKLAKLLDIDYDELDFTLPDSRLKNIMLRSSDLVIFGVPVIAGRVPNLLLPYLNSIKGNGALGVSLVMFGNRNYDDALIELQSIMLSRDITTIAGGAFVGEHSFSNILGQNRPDENDLKDADKFVNLIYNKIGKNDFSIPQVNGNPLYKLYYIPKDKNGNNIDIRKVKPKTNNNCIKCGVCANVCPLGSISFDNFKDVNGICMKCCACIKKCPQGAKYFDNSSFIYHRQDLEKRYIRYRKNNEYFAVE